MSEVAEMIESTHVAPVSDATPTRRPVNFRSVLLGLLGVCFICGLTAYNDYVVANTFMVGNFLPIGLLLFFLVFILLINAPLRKLAPRIAFSMGELGVALAMVLASCALPSSGLMRFLPAYLVGPWYSAGINADHAKVMADANLPDWLFPKFQRMDVQGRANDPIIRYFWDRVPIEEDSFTARVLAVPWGAWITPAIAWGILVGLVVLGMVCLSIILRRQWVENERLPYPLAGVYTSLIEEPKPGHAFNALFSNWLFWAAAGAVFVLHGVNALSKYDPKSFPAIPIRYAFGTLFSNPPFSYTDYGFKSAGVYFCMVGIVYFLQSNVAFSLWFSYIIIQITKMILGDYQAELTWGMSTDQNLGSALMFTATILYVARQHLLVVLKQMFRRPLPDEPHGRYMPYFMAGWGLVFSVIGMFAWMMVVGMSPLASAVTIAFCGMIFLVVARVVAETGIIFLQMSFNVSRPMVLLAQSMPEALTVKTSLKSFVGLQMISGIMVQDARESIGGFIPQSLRVADGAAYEGESRWQRAIPFTFALLFAMAVGYVVSGAGMLYTEYSYSATADRKQSAPLNPHAVDVRARDALDTSREYGERGGPAENHNRWFHVGMGAGITGFLGAMRLRFASWPLHPVGYLLAYSYPMQMIWFSIMIGWLAKVVIVKYGGASMYRAVKPLFMGLIIGEVGAAAFWLVVSLVLNMLGLPYYAINLLPG